jgi:hypothetical protein
VKLAVDANEVNEQRAAKRVDVNWRYKGLSSFEKLLSGSLTNISSSGALISGITPLTQGEKIELRISANTEQGNREIITSALVNRVIMKDELYFAGISFLSLHSADKILIAELTSLPGSKHKVC